MSSENSLTMLKCVALALAMTSGCATKQKSYKDWEPPPPSVVSGDDSGNEGQDEPQRRTDREPQNEVREESLPNLTLPDQGATAQAELVPVGDDVKADAEMVALLAPFKATVDKRVLRVVGFLTAPLERARGESTLGNFVSDAMRDEIERLAGEKTDLCFTNSGGLRRDVPAGKVTEGTLVELMPFDNAIVVFTMRGTALKSVLKRMNRRGDPGSGVREKEGRFTVGGSPLDPDRTYTICTNDYVFEGGGKYNFKSAKDIRYTGVLLRDVIIAGFEREHKAGRKITPKLDGRARQAPR